MSSSVGKKGGDAKVTMTVLGCGNMALAVLSGIFASLTDSNSSSPPPGHPSRFIACNRSQSGTAKVLKVLGHYKLDLKTVRNENVAACKEADIVLLGCKPYMVNDLLAVEGMRDALEGKLLISVCAGVPVEQMEKALYGGSSEDHAETSRRCRLVRVLPNMAAAIRESMTVVATSTPPLPEDMSTIITWIFKQVGEVIYLPPNMMDISTALSGSSGPFFSLMLEAATDGAVAMGLTRPEALKMAAYAMRGTAGLVLNGEHPAVLREKASSPGGCTIGGLLVLEEAGVRGAIAKAVREATCVASLLGSGVKNVNGTR
ncbi:MAG: delta 1-pyrroline-5-carboxylate reductase [Claussenomyces sp. TS43310]|nr:MAG: delta 1-pyrroline-5-carboxylate reductase [Claussenomyces sp. TS43310]